MKHFPLIRSWKAALVSTLLIALPLFLFSLTMETSVYAVVLALLFLPLGLCLAGALGGFAPLLVSAGAAILAMQRVLGAPGLQLTAIYILPIAAAFVILLETELPFKKAAPVMILTHIAALTGVYLLLQQMTNQNLYTAAGDAAMAVLADWEMGDTLLYQFYASGLITLPDSLKDTALLPLGQEGFRLSSAARADMLLSVRTLVSGMLTAFVPSFLVGHSLMSGLGCLYIPLRTGYTAAARRLFRNEGAADAVTTPEGKLKPNFPTLDTPPLSLWHLPRGIGWKVGTAMAIGYFLQQSAQPALAMAGVILYVAATTLFEIQGIALINFMQKAKGTKTLWRVLVPALLFTLSILSYVGIFDQITNVRRLRKPREPKEE